MELMLGLIVYSSQNQHPSYFQALVSFLTQPVIYISNCLTDMTYDMLGKLLLCMLWANRANPLVNLPNLCFLLWMEYKIIET